MKKSGKKNETGSNDIVSEIEKRFERHTNILMEEMKCEVKTVAEGHAAIMRKLENHDNKFDEVDKRFDKIDAKLVEHDKKFDKIDAKLIEHDKKFAKVESELQSISVALMETGHETKGYEKRIKKLEEKVLI